MFIFDYALFLFDFLSPCIIKLREINNEESGIWVWDPRDLGSSLCSLCNQVCDFGQVPLHLSASSAASEGLVHGQAASASPC